MHSGKRIEMETTTVQFATFLECTNCGNQWEVFMVLESNDGTIDIACKFCGERKVKDITQEVMESWGKE